MKISKTLLKNLIKECLVEILSEGLSPSSPGGFLQEHAAKQTPQLPRRQPTRPSQRQFDPSLDTPVNPAVTQAVKDLSSGVKDPTMASIFADTAKTSLPNMLQNGGASEGSSSAPTLLEHINGTPEDVFGEEVAGKWAELAFPSTPFQRR